MTLRYTEMNQHDARYNLARAYPGGIEMLARRMGMSVNVLRNKLAPSITTHHISDEEDSLIIEYSQEAKVPDARRALIAKNWRHGLIAFEMPDVSHLSDESLAQSMLRAVKEFGDVMTAVPQAIGGHRPPPAVLDALEKEMQEAMAALCELRARVMGTGESA
ncbi:MAG: phage regulatory CII family protein [Burkholderiaceae bacterium]